tara:strand:+ start:763 stop:996 length:234 start_codon:yes stop_codon:yes gene_type:complete
MILKFLLMDGHGIFVWLSFMITFLGCAAIYYKTYKTLKKYEMDFAKELKLLNEKDRKLVLRRSKVANQVYALYNKSI